MSENSDIKENVIYNEDPKLVELLLIDRTKTTNEDVHNIMWATDNCAPMGQGYQEWDEINIERITGENGMLLRPRVNKSKAEQEYRSRDKAEVFTPAWICNKQNNLIDAAWFSGTSPFNIENDDNTWESATGKIPFPTTAGKTWQDYVKDTRLEMACGEAPYLVSRYGVVSGMDISIKERIGVLDRKLRVVSENVDNVREWIKWATIAYQNTYGFEWQGDNLLLAREAVTNMIIHADFMVNGLLRIEKYDDRIVLTNPGLLKLPLEQIYHGGESKARNQRMQNMFRMIGYGENLGSGFPLILNAWNEKHWLKPELQEQSELMQVKLILHVQPDPINDPINGPINGPIKLTERQELILQMFAENKSLSRERICEKTGLSDGTIKREIAFLKKSGYLERVGSLKTGYWKVNSRFTRSVSRSDV